MVRKRPEVVEGTTMEIMTGCGKLFVTITKDEDGIVDVFATLGKNGGCMRSQTEAIGRLLSIGLRSGLDPLQLAENLRGIRCEKPAWGENGVVLSCSDAIAIALENAINVV